MSWVRGLLLGLVVLAWGCGGNGLPPGTKRAAALQREIANDRKAAEEQLFGKDLFVMGTIKEIAGGRVDLATDDQDASVRCEFSDTQRSSIDRAAKGQEVVIRGRWDSQYAGGDVRLRGCSFYRLPAPRQE